MGWSLVRHHCLDLPQRFLVHECLKSRLDRHDPRILPYTFEHDCHSFIHDRDPLLGIHCYPDAVASLRGRRVVHLCRDPRDVVVSWYHALSKRTSPRSTKYYRGALGEFVREDYHGLHWLIRYLNFWEAHRGVSAAYLRVTYEQLHAEPVDTVAEVLKHCGHHGVSRSAISEAVEFASFDAMRAMEWKRYARAASLAAYDPSNRDAYKTRRGIVGSHRDELSSDDQRVVDARISSTLSPAYPQYLVPRSASDQVVPLAPP
jgi:hypothetical protein